jgi:hypothetical protein
LAVLAGIGVGLYFLVMWVWPMVAPKLGLG